ncbi:hypothetical protein U1299_02720 [Enterococcus cecorum]|uniref:Uncharacterized protein n=1 Tax=Enterococcus cecorum TaxID=44008 RepID=A0AAW9JXS7_9ENTE|nr:hypothetical protein [Enterococcus cecorum]MCJ0598724.1 hypothetical protein [Enterococcus cecorum]MCJ0604400.1 hypothetical protein [Enterococcus cecorum]MDZ5505460.1 hypothetical protein [Enterococcus cecorum]MDZ5532892.1 hypothetical protein [Enterococcus cecorum]MDZ5544111.1 hypothetical protein [Enterococcus cecorum]
MKKKNLKKLLKNFRPSMEQTKNRLFRELENKALNQYQMPIKVYTYKNRKNELFIEFLGQTTKDKLLTVPLDKTFDTIIKRIQNEEPGLFEQFSSNLVEEIVTYWYQEPKRSNTENQQASTEVAQEVTPVQEKVKEEKIAEIAPTTDPTSKKEESTQSGYDTFVEKITAFPKFTVKKLADEIQVIEQAANERLLATISTSQVGQFTIESALERKYKLKLEVIPVIEDFANTPLENR